MEAGAFVHLFEKIGKTGNIRNKIIVQKGMGEQKKCLFLKSKTCEHLKELVAGGKLKKNKVKP